MWKNNISSSSVQILTGTRTGAGGSSGTISLPKSITTPIIYGQSGNSSSNSNYPGMMPYVNISGDILPSSNCGNEFFAGFNLKNNQAWITCQSEANSTRVTTISITKASSTSLSFSLGSSSSTTFDTSGYTYYWFLVAI